VSAGIEKPREGAADYAGMKMLGEDPRHHGKVLSKGQMWGGAIFLLVWFSMDAIMFVHWLYRLFWPDASPGPPV
jgi:hypothetical protein